MAVTPTDLALLSQAFVCQYTQISTAAGSRASMPVKTAGRIAKKKKSKQPRSKPKKEGLEKVLVRMRAEPANANAPFEHCISSLSKIQTTRQPSRSRGASASWWQR